MSSTYNSAMAFDDLDGIPDDAELARLVDYYPTYQLAHRKALLRGIFDGRTHTDLVLAKLNAKGIEYPVSKQSKGGHGLWVASKVRRTVVRLLYLRLRLDQGMSRRQANQVLLKQLWNAARFVLMNTEDRDCGQHEEACALALPDRWIVSRLQQTERAVHRAFAGYRFDLAAQALHDFAWHDYCDWYLELSKPLLNDAARTAEEQRGTRRTLVRVLETLLRLAHPIIPFITEEIWQRVAPLAGVKGPSLMLARYPVPDESRIDATAEADIEWLQQCIVAVRNIRGELGIAPGRSLVLLLRNAGADDRRRVAEHGALLRALAKLESVGFHEAAEAPTAATQLVGQMELLVPLAGLIDLGAERARLLREEEKLSKEIAKLEAKLGNEGFVAKAPAEVVARERARLAELGNALSTLQRQRESLEAQ